MINKAQRAYFLKVIAPTAASERLFRKIKEADVAADHAQRKVATHLRTIGWRFA